MWGPARKWRWAKEMKWMLARIRVEWKWLKLDYSMFLFSFISFSIISLCIAFVTNRYDWGDRFSVTTDMYRCKDTLNSSWLWNIFVLYIKCAFLSRTKKRWRFFPRCLLFVQLFIWIFLSFWLGWTYGHFVCKIFVSHLACVRFRRLCEMQR